MSESKGEGKMSESKDTGRGMVEYTSRDGQTIKLSFDVVRRYLVSGKPELVTDQEIMFYTGTCKARGLNPFKKDCYLIKYTADDPAAVIVAIDYFRSRAKAQPDCRGWHSGILVVNEKETVYRAGALLMPGDTLLGAWFRAKPFGWDEPFEWTVPLNAYIKKTRDGRPTRFWAEENQPMQIAKVAESQGLRHVWPDEFQGLRIEGDEAIDVTPPPAEPLKIPIKKTERAESKPAPSPESGEQSLSRADIAMLKIDSLTKEDWPDKDSDILNDLIRGLDEKDKVAVCKYWMERKKEVAGV